MHNNPMGISQRKILHGKMAPLLTKCMDAHFQTKLFSFLPFRSSVITVESLFSNQYPKFLNVLLSVMKYIWPLELDREAKKTYHETSNNKFKLPYISMIASCCASLF